MRAGPLLAASLLLASCTPPKSPRVENAVLICLDTVRYDTLELVREGLHDDEASRWWNRSLRVTRAQSTAPWTLPAVASVFTGAWPNTHRAGAFPEPVANLHTSYPLPLVQGFPTLASQLRERGFETVGIVASRWFRTGHQLGLGFASLDTEPQLWTDVLERTEAWLETRAAQPAPGRFLLYLHFMEAHGPSIMGRRALDRRIETLPPELAERALAASPPACARDRAALPCRRYLGYVAAVSASYRAVARVLEALEAHALLDATAVVLFSDHGEEFLDHADEERAHALDPRGTYGLGHGHSLYQEQLHVPLVFWHPALPGGERAIPASLVDLVPTLLAWLGLEPSWPAAGVDLGPALAGAPFDPERPLYSSSVAFGPEREAVVRGDRKRIADGGSGAGALGFDLAHDPDERTPVELADRDALDALLAGYRSRRAPRAGLRRPSRAEVEALQALGYLRGIE